MTLLKTYQRLLKERFVLVQCVQTGSLMAIGDVISQEVVEKRKWKDYRARRTLEFAFLGCCLIGPAITVWYKFLAKQFGHERNPYTAIKKMASDQLLFAPVVLSTFITSLEVLHGNEPEKIKEIFKNEYFGILKANWTVWPAAQMINFYFMPLQFQVLFAQTVAIFWNTYLSFKTQNPK